MTAKKKILTEEELEEAKRQERERMEEVLAANPGIMPPTGGKDARAFEPPIEFPGEPLSQTIIKMRRC